MMPIQRKIYRNSGFTITMCYQLLFVKEREGLQFPVNMALVIDLTVWKIKGFNGPS